MINISNKIDRMVCAFASDKTKKREVMNMRVKSILTLVIVLLLGLLSSNQGFAETWGDYEYSESGGEVTITKYIGSGGDVNIPSAIAGKPVTEIGYAAFVDCRSLTNLTIPSSVKEIGRYAFSGCSNLTNFAIPSSVIHIDNSAFRGCSSLTSVTIPSSVTYLGLFNFWECGQLESIIVDASNAHYSSQDGVLYNKSKTSLILCPERKTGSLIIPNGVTDIEDSAFRGCSGLTSVTIPSSVANIGDYAFNGCSSLTNFTILFNVTSIGSEVFGDCGQLESIFVDASNAHYSSIEGVLYTKNKTTLIRCPARKIGFFAIPEGVTDIEGSAFRGCNSLTCVTIPSSVTNIEYNAFGDCGQLESIFVDDSNAHYTSITGVLYNKSTTNLIRCPGGKTGSFTIPDDVTDIEDSAFSGCRGLNNVTLHSNVASIGYFAFMGCTSLTRITIPSSVTYIGPSAFDNCDQLESIIVDASNAHYASTDGVLYTKDKSILIRCPGGKTGSFTIPKGVIRIEDSAFRGCIALTHITTPSSVTYIDRGAFSLCGSLTNIAFCGDAPFVVGDSFDGSTNAVVCFFEHAIGWPTPPDPWEERPTAYLIPSLVFWPDGGLYIVSNVQVTISCNIAEITIRYTTDGTDPTVASESKVSGGKLTVPVPVRLKAQCWKDGVNLGAVKTADYIAAPRAPTPSFSPDGGKHVGSSVNVRVTCDILGARICYTSGSGTTPGDDPTRSSSMLNAEGIVTVPLPGWLKAKAWIDDMSPSFVQTAVYEPIIASPVHRLYSIGAPESTYTHLWTLSETERDVLDSWPSWRYEGIAWYAYPSQPAGAVPLYRLYEPNIQRHLYTMDTTEYEVLGNKTWNQEGIQYYVYPNNA
ncbi:MAG: leucine-rich repeat protein, partial [Lentisphaerae bacterium]|nr:leucine-rich repeat protein [Lentisphaerota bacterium]